MRWRTSSAVTAADSRAPSLSNHELKILEEVSGERERPPQVRFDGLRAFDGLPVHDSSLSEKPLEANLALAEAVRPGCRLEVVRVQPALKRLHRLGSLERLSVDPILGLDLLVEVQD